jgi:hypothetical protein
VKNNTNNESITILEHDMMYRNALTGQRAVGDIARRGERDQRQTTVSPAFDSMLTHR